MLTYTLVAIKERQNGRNKVDFLSFFSQFFSSSNTTVMGRRTFFSSFFFTVEL
jgi:hypothetical protein